MIIHIDDLKIRLRHRFLIKIKRFFRGFFSKNKPQFPTIKLQQQKNAQQFTINTIADLCDILQYSPEKTAIYTALEPHLPVLIPTARVLFGLTRGLNAHQKTSLLLAFKAYLPSVIKTDLELILIFSDIHDERRLEVLLALKDSLPSIINSLPSFFWLCMVINKEHRFEVIKATLDHVASLITNHDDLSRIINYAPNANEKIALMLALKNGLAFDFKPTLGFLKKIFDLKNTAERTSSLEFIIAVKQNSPNAKLNLSSEEFNELSKFYRGNLKTKLFVAFKDDLLSITNTTSVDQLLNTLLYGLTTPQKAEVIVALKDHLSVIIKNVGNFTEVFNLINDVKQKAEVLVALKDHFPAIIKDSFDFRRVISLIDDELQQSLIIALKDHFPAIIKDAFDLRRVLSSINDEVQQTLIIALKDHLPAIIKNIDDLRKVLSSIYDEKQQTLIITLKDHLPVIIKNTDDFSKVFNSLTDLGVKTALTEELKNHLPASAFEKIEDEVSDSISKANDENAVNAKENVLNDQTKPSVSKSGATLFQPMQNQSANVPFLANEKLADPKP